MRQYTKHKTVEINKNNTHRGMGGKSMEMHCNSIEVHLFYPDNVNGDMCKLRSPNNCYRSSLQRKMSMLQMEKQSSQKL